MTRTPTLTPLFAFDWSNVSAGQLLIVLTILVAAYALYKASPIGHDTVEAYKALLEVEEKKLRNAEADAAERFAQVEALKTQNNELKVSLARCEERPSTDQLASAMMAMQDGFSQHRDDLLHTQNRILGHLESTTEAIKSMEQVLTLVAERLHADANRRRDQQG